MNGFDLSTISSVYVGSTLYSSIYKGSTLIWPTGSQQQIYDYEVEYLESTGTLYIETGIIPDANTGIYIKAGITNTSDQYIVGLRNNSSNTRWGIAKSSGSGWYYLYGSYARIGVNISLNPIAECKLNYLNDGYYSVKGNNGGTAQITLSSLSFTPEYNIRLFGTAGVNAGYTKYTGRLYAVKITQGSSIVMDLIPVRVGQVGYMYDKISGTLLGNDGTGDFVLGPDKQ